MMSKIAHCYDENGEYTGSCPIEPNQYTGKYNFPENSTKIDPEITQGKKAYFNGKHWVKQESEK
ncbi:hypothetical protein [Pseudoalteromonas distincta]|uniref:hypothetical protein n=1 Tax=Pseudoalteromonas distincta TaxID=77608 RepID=UPI0039ED59AE